MWCLQQARFRSHCWSVLSPSFSGPTPCFTRLRVYTGGFANLTNAAVRRSKWQEEEALRRCAIVAYSSAWAAGTAKDLTAPRKVRLLPFGPNTPSEYSAQQIASFAQARRERGACNCELLFVGVDWERKGGNTAFETARLLNEAGTATRLRVVGAKPAQALPQFVEYLGFIDKNSPDGLRRLTDLYCEADFFILPTLAETAGIVFCEANSFGVPLYLLRHRRSQRLCSARCEWHLFGAQFSSYALCPEASLRSSQRKGAKRSYWQVHFRNSRVA